MAPKRNPAVNTFSVLNATHAVDLAELGANEATGGDVLYEAKCASPTKASQSAGNGSKDYGGAVASAATSSAACGDRSWQKLPVNLEN